MSMRAQCPRSRAFQLRARLLRVFCCREGDALVNAESERRQYRFRETRGRWRRHRPLIPRKHRDFSRLTQAVATCVNRCRPTNQYSARSQLSGVSRHVTVGESMQLLENFSAITYRVSQKQSGIRLVLQSGAVTGRQSPRGRYR